MKVRFVAVTLAVACFTMSMSPEIQDSELGRRLWNHVEHLAGKVGERNALRYRNLEAARDYIEGRISEMGYTLERQVYQVESRDYRNLIAEKPGATAPERIFVVGAHYDTAPGTPGADDNASGVACLLELARLLSERKPAMTLRFVAFTLEEPPFFRTSSMGSRVYARKLRSENVQVAGMISLEMVGFYSDQRGSQQFPLPLMNRFFTDRGDFVAVAGNFASRRLVRELGNSLRSGGQIPVEHLALPWIPGVGLSDNWSFWNEGYSAAMITDTAFFRNPHYHRYSDLPPTLDYRRMARLVSGLSRVLADLNLR